MLADQNSSRSRSFDHPTIAVGQKKHGLSKDMHLHGHVRRLHRAASIAREVSSTSPFSSGKVIRMLHCPLVQTENMTSNLALAEKYETAADYEDDFM